MQIAVTLALVLLGALSLVGAVCGLLFVRICKPAVWIKYVEWLRLRSWRAAGEELQALTPTSASTPVQIVSTSVNNECHKVDVNVNVEQLAEIECEIDSKQRPVTISSKLNATAVSLLRAAADSRPSFTAQRSFGPLLTLDDAIEPDMGFSRAHSFNSKRRISTPNAKEFLKVSNETQSQSLSRAASSESFVSDTATPELEGSFRTPRITLEFHIQFCEESKTLTFLHICLNGIQDVSGSYAVKFVLGPRQKSESTEYARPSSNGCIYFAKEQKFSKIKAAKLDSYDVTARLLKKNANVKGECESGFTQFQLDFLYLLRSALLKFGLEEVDSTLHCPGEIIISLSYLPTAQRVTVVMIKAKDLKTTEDVLVKSYLIENGKITCRKRTSAKKRCDLVSWTEVIIFRPEAINIEKCQLRFYVASVADNNHNQSSPTNTLGFVHIGPDSLGSGLIHWHQMMNSPRKAIVMSHRLQPY